MHGYQHKIPTRPQHAPHKWEQLDYAAKTQQKTNKSDKRILPPEDRKCIQKVGGNFLYYTRAVDPTMLVAVGTLVVEM